MNFLALCQALARESGTLQAGRPTTVVGQTGREAKMVAWIQAAWRSIQNSRGDWRWMQGRFLGSTINGQQEYTGTEMSATRFGDWVYTGDRRENRFSVFTPSEPEQEGSLTFMDWDNFFVTQLRRPPANDKPTLFTITPEGKIALSPTPDAVYSIRGLYKKDEQPLAADGDIPEMPSRHHDLIIRAATIYLTVADEAMQQIPQYQLMRLEGWSNLARDQLPRMTVGGPLA